MRNRGTELSLSQVRLRSLLPALAPPFYILIHGLKQRFELQPACLTRSVSVDILPLQRGPSSAIPETHFAGESKIDGGPSWVLTSNRGSLFSCLIDCTYSRGSPGSTADPGHPAFGCFAQGISRHSSATKALNAGQSLTKSMQYILLCHVRPFHHTAQSPLPRTFPRRLALVSFVVSRLVRKNRPDEICAERMSAITSRPAGICAGVGKVARTCVVDLS